MAKPFDAATKQIVEVNPQDWLERLGFPRLRVEIVDADLAAVTTDADRILRTLDPPISLFHFEFEAGRDARRAPQRCHRYNALAETLYDSPIATVLFLLNPRAGRVSEVTGLYERTHPHTGLYLQFRYRVIRVWELSVKSLLAGGLATLPLALLSDISGMEPGTVVETMCRRLTTEAISSDQAETLMTASYLLAGLRFSDTIVASLFKGVLNMEESSTYQAIIERGMTRGIERGLAQGREEGRVDEARRMLRAAGEGRLGVPSASAQERLNSLASADAFEALGRRLFAVETWDALLAS